MGSEVQDSGISSNADDQTVNVNVDDDDGVGGDNPGEERATGNEEEGSGSGLVVEAPKYVDPHKMAEVLEVLEEEVFDNESAMAKLHVKVLEMKKQIKKINDNLDRIKPLPNTPKAPIDAYDLPECKIVTRKEWNAQSPTTTESMGRMKKPICKVNITYSTDTDPCEKQEECKNIVKAVQQRHMDEGFPDISYSFLVGEDGYVYEGRGWHWTPNAPKEYGSTNEVLDVAFIGRYNNEMYPFSQLNVLMSLMQNGIDQEFVHQDYEFYDIVDGKIRKLE